MQILWGIVRGPPVTARVEDTDCGGNSLWSLVPYADLTTTWLFKHITVVCMRLCNSQMLLRLLEQKLCDYYRQTHGMGFRNAAGNSITSVLHMHHADRQNFGTSEAFWTASFLFSETHTISVISVTLAFYHARMESYVSHVL